MAGITMAQAESKLTEVQSAISAVLTGQEYRIGNRSLTRANLQELIEAEKYYNQLVQRLSRD